MEIRSDLRYFPDPLYKADIYRVPHRESDHDPTLSRRHSLLLVLAASASRPAVRPRAAAAASRSRSSPTRPRRAPTKSSRPPSRRPREGKGVSFSQSYGPSGEQSRAVANGQHADLVNFSLEPDVERLVKNGMVQPSWNQTPTKGMVTNSVDVIIVRKGNPKHITGWSDLVKPGVQVLTPNPFTSGAARWNVVGAYGAQLKEGKTEAQAEEYLKQLFHNVVSQDSSARNALQTFLAGPRRRAARLRDRGDRRPEEGRADRIHHPRRHDPDRKPAGRRRLQRSGQEVRRLPRHAGRAADLGRTGLPPGDQGRARPPPSSRTRPASSRSPTSAAGRRSTKSSSKRKPAWSRRSRNPLASQPANSAALRGAPRGAARRSRAEASGVLGRGLLVLYLSILVLLPMAALASKAFDGGTHAFWKEISSPEAWAAIKLTLIASVVVVLINAVFGTIIAWVLVRDEFPGKGIVNASSTFRSRCPRSSPGSCCSRSTARAARSASTCRSRAQPSSSRCCS